MATLKDLAGFFSVKGNPVSSEEIKALSQEDKKELKNLLDKVLSNRALFREAWAEGNCK